MATLVLAAEREKAFALDIARSQTAFLRDEIISHADLILRRLAEFKADAGGRVAMTSTPESLNREAAMAALVLAAEREKALALDIARSQTASLRDEIISHADIVLSRIADTRTDIAASFSNVSSLRSQIAEHADLALRRLEENKQQIVEATTANPQQLTSLDRISAFEALVGALQKERDAALVSLTAFQSEAERGRATRSDGHLAAMSASYSEFADLILRRLVDAEARQEEMLRVVTSHVVTQRSGVLVRPNVSPPVTGALDAASRYLDLLEGVLTESIQPFGKAANNLRRMVGRDWPKTALTMIGTARMRNIRHLLTQAIDDKVPGDIIETGVWRGGACIYMRAILEAYGEHQRRVFVADSFKGLPPPDAMAFPTDAEDKHHTFDQLAISRAEVEANFKRFDLLNDQVVFLEGWFKDTLHVAPIEKLAILRLDGDMYESTMQALDALYAKVSPGGYVIVDDYILPPCAKAIDDFRQRHGIVAELHEVDGAAVWWQVP